MTFLNLNLWTDAVLKGKQIISFSCYTLKYNNTFIKAATQCRANWNNSKSHHHQRVTCKTGQLCIQGSQKKGCFDASWCSYEYLSRFMQHKVPQVRKLQSEARPNGQARRPTSADREGLKRSVLHPGMYAPVQQVKCYLQMLTLCFLSGH